MPNDPEDFNKINPDKKDDIIDSSFGVRFTPGDKTESVADKLKETKENLEKKAADINAAGGTSRFDASAVNFKDNFKDEFDNFEFDSSISAFKPFSTPAQTDTAASTPMPETMKPSKASTEPVFPKDGGTFDKPVLSTKSPEPSKDAIPEFNNIKGKENSATTSSSNQATDLILLLQSTIRKQVLLSTPKNLKCPSPETSTFLQQKRFRLLLLHPQHLLLHSR